MNIIRIDEWQEKRFERLASALIRRMPKAKVERAIRDLEKRASITETQDRP